MKLSSLVGGLLAAVLAFAPAARAEDGWSGEGSVAAGFTTGNSKTTDVGAGLKGARQFGDWRAKAELAADYGENDNKVSRDRQLLAGQLDRDLGERVYVFGRGSYESDQFAGYDTRYFAGAGAGYRVLMGETTSWTLEAAPGYRWDNLTDGREEEGFAARAGSAFKHAFNEAVSVSNDTEVLYAEASTQVANVAAITAKLNDKLAARFSYGIRHETEAPRGRKATDTATRLSLVFGF